MINKLTKRELIDCIVTQENLIDTMSAIIKNHEEIDENNNTIITNLKKIDRINLKKIELLDLQLRAKDLIISSLVKEINELKRTKEEDKAEEID